ncbi:MAG: RraA family protein [Alphaproteobacteria bacterium]|nr:RraA family protein [Alphaproteobacteria bacterium]
MGSIFSTDFKRPTPEIIDEARSISTSSIHEAAGKIGSLPSAIKPLNSSLGLCGPAFTVKGAPGDNLWLHYALAEARPGDILVADMSGFYEAGYWGEVMSVSAQSRGVAGLVINGCVRDGKAMIEMGFPVFSRGTCMRGTEKNPEFKGAIAESLPIGDVIVEAGDLVIGDFDGVVVIPNDRIKEVITSAKDRDARELEMMKELRKGITTLEINGWEVK